MDNQDRALQSKVAAAKPSLADKVKAAIDLHEGTLKEGCQRLIKLNQQLLKTERKQMRKQMFFRLGWIILVSSLVVLIGYLTEAMNIFTVVGLFAAYFIGTLLHNLFSPEIVLPKARTELFEFNHSLREQIAAVEEQNDGLLFQLLAKTGLEEQAETNGLKLEKAPIDIYQLDGNGLYQYLDAMNLLMEQPEPLAKLA